ncbi:alpha/beta hydrolase [Microbacterium sp. GXF7504]
MTGTEDTLQDGLEARIVETGRIAAAVIERPAQAPPERTIVFLHDMLASSLLWQDLLVALPAGVRGVAVDLRGFGDTENLPVDATRGLGDFADDLHATLETLELSSVHLVGWGLGGSVALRFALEHPVRSLTLIAPFSPYGLGGTRRDGSRLTDDDAGTGAGLSNPEFVRRLMGRDETDEAESSPRSLIRHDFVADPGAVPHEDLWVQAMLATSTAGGNYPGDSIPSETWPGYAAGTTGVLNALAPSRCDLSGIAGIDPKPPILWVHGELDAIVSDTSFIDVDHLGALGIAPGWPGEEIAPAQPMIAQTRDVLDAYRQGGGQVRELALPQIGHTPHLEAPERVRRAILAHTGLLDDPPPTTEQIILKSSD